MYKANTAEKKTEIDTVFKKLLMYQEITCLQNTIINLFLEKQTDYKKNLMAKELVLYNSHSLTTCNLIKNNNEKLTGKNTPGNFTK